MSDGIYRRRILLVADSDAVVGDLEDDFHRFRVALRHDGRQVTGISGEAKRFPWSECAGAVDPLQKLEGMPLSDRLVAAAEHADPRRNCTHLFDLASLAIAHAARGRARRQYDAAVPDRSGTRTRPELWRDGSLVLSWDLEGMTIVGPAPFDGVRLTGGFLQWAEQHLDPDTAEAAAVLRRACAISLGRGHGFEQMDRALDVGEFMLGTCYTFQPGTAEVALRMKGTTRDFTDAPAGLLTD